MGLNVMRKLEWISGYKIEWILISASHPYHIGFAVCNLLLALQLHGFAEKFDFGMDTCVETSVLNMYIKCGAMDFAQKVFCRTPNPSLCCWNSMIYGYSKGCRVL